MRQGVAYKATCDLYLPVRILKKKAIYMRACIVFNLKLFALTSQALEGVESELKVETKTTDAFGSKEREYISNKATKKKKKERKYI